MSVRAVAAGQLIAPLMMAAVSSVATYGLSSSNTPPVTRAGAGARPVSGYTVTNVHYNLNATDPRNIDSVTFDVDVGPPAGAAMKVKLESAGTAWYGCSARGVTLTCDTTVPQVTAAVADELAVVIGL